MGRVGMLLSMHQATESWPSVRALKTLSPLSVDVHNCGCVVYSLEMLDLPLAKV